MGQDLRVAIRSWLRRPGVLLATWLTLALGIGASTAVFAALDALLLRPLPYPAPDRLVHVTNGPLIIGPRPGVSRWFTDLDEVVAASLWHEGGVNLELGAASHRVTAASVTDGFFDTMGVPPLLGGVLPVGEPQARSVVISHRVWRVFLGGERDVVGREVSINARSYRVAGVMPATFGFPGRADVWLPAGADFQATGDVYAPEIVARLAPGVPLTHVENVARRVSDERDRTRGRPRGPDDPALTLTSLVSHLSTPVRPTMVLLSVSVGVLLLVVCVGVTNVLLARVAGRRRELSVRRALGAGRWRLARGLLIEGLVIVVAGGAAGVGLAWWLISGLGTLVPAVLQESLAISPAWRIVTVGVAVMLVAALLAGLVPAWMVAARTDGGVVRGGRDLGGDASTHQLRNALVVSQMALALMLLGASGAALSALAAASRTSLGFGGTEAIAMDVMLPSARFATTEAVTNYVDAGLLALTSAPGVRRAAATSVLPGAPGVRAAFRLRDARQPQAGPAVSATLLTASPDYFQAMGIRLLHGRPFGAADRRGSNAVAILSESAARDIFGDPARAVGAGITSTMGREAIEYQVVGVVPDVRLRGAAALPGGHPQLYLPIAQYPPYGVVSFVAESEGLADGIRASATAALAHVDASIPVHRVRAIDAVAASFVATQRVSGVLVSAFAGTTLLVAAIALFGLLSQVVSERGREIGIRLALGATPGSISRRFVGQALRLSSIGAIAGAGVALLGLKALEVVVPSLERIDGSLVAGSAAILLVVATLAAWRPAARARSVDPVVVLRDEV